MTTHERYNLMISLLLDNMLTPQEEEELHQHIETCVQCGDLFDNMLSLDVMFKTSVEAAPPPDFTAQVMARVDAHEAQRRWLPWFIGLLVFASLMAGATIAAPVMIFAFGLDALIPDAASLMEIVTQATHLFGAAAAGVASLWLAVGSWFGSVASQPAALALSLAALVLASTWIGLLEVFKPRALVAAR